MSLLLPTLAVVAFLAFSGGGKRSSGKDNTIPRNLVVGSYLGQFTDGVIVDIGPDIPTNITEAVINAAVPLAQENPHLVFNIVTNNEVQLTSVEEEGIVIDGVHKNELLTFFGDPEDVKANLAYATHFANTGVDPLDA